MMDVINIISFIIFFFKFLKNSRQIQIQIPVRPWDVQKRCKRFVPRKSLL